MTNPIYATNTQILQKESVAELFNRLYGDVYKNTSRYALENNLHQLENQVKSIRMVESINDAVGI